MTPLPSILVADYVDHTARLVGGGAGYVVHSCRPIDVRPSLLQAHRPDVLILAVSRVRGCIKHEDLDGRYVPVIVVSAHANDAVERRSTAAQRFSCGRLLCRGSSMR